MEQHAVLKQGAKEYRRWSDRVLTVDTENGCVYLSEKKKPDNTTHHKLYVQSVQTWPNYKPRYITENSRSPEAMLTFRIRGIGVDAAHDDRSRISESREGSPSLRPSRVRNTSSLTDSTTTPSRPTMPPPLAVPPAAVLGTNDEQSSNGYDGVCRPEGPLALSSDSVSARTNSPSSPCSPVSPAASLPSSVRSRPEVNGGSNEWWMIRTGSITQLARVLLSFQHMNPEKFNAHKLLAPAQACLVAGQHTDL